MELPLAALALSSSAVTWLPSEILSRIFSFLPSPLDLYHASKVCRGWRSMAVDPRLWQEHYWTFYRAISYPENDEERLLASIRSRSRRKAMRAWVDSSRASPPPSPLGALCVFGPAGSARTYEPLSRGLLVLNSIEGHGSMEDLGRRLRQVTLQQYGHAGPSNAEEATRRILPLLTRQGARSATQNDLEYAEDALPLWEYVVATTYGFNPGAALFPPFLEHASQGEQGPLEWPDFYGIFVRRLRQDQQLLNDLRTHIALGSNRLVSLLTIVDRYGAAAKDLLFALCASQQLSPHSIGTFTEAAHLDTTDSSANWPSALAVHTSANGMEPKPHLSACIALCHTAHHLLSHLQRREAVRSMRQLHQRFSSPAQAAVKTPKERMLKCSRDVEDALAISGLFHFGEASEVSAHLDLIALYVWADLDASGRWSELDPVDPPSPAAENDSWAATTRFSIVRIEDSLNRLGFQITTEPDENDLANFFINVPLFCPAQRACADFVFSAILCAVCRRLGVAATPTNAPGWVTVVEDSSMPEYWLGLDRDWDRFYFVPSREGRRHRILEASAVAETVARLTAEDRGGRSRQDFLEPAWRLDILHTTGAQLSHALRRHIGRSAEGVSANDLNTLVSTSSCGAHPSQQISLLRDHLWGRIIRPPCPLPPAALASSLALVPSTRPDAPRSKSLAYRQEARCCALWVIRLLEPDSIGGVEQVDDLLMDVMRKSPHLRCDIALLLEAQGCHVKTQLSLTREVLRDDADGEAADFSDCNYVDGPEPPAAVQEFLFDVLRNDMAPNRGLGGNGGCKLGERKQELLDPAHPRNAAVQYGVGTVFTHRERGYRAVVFGWDSRCKKVDETVPTDRKPPGGLKQPFYYAYAEDGSLTYVAQSNIVVARVPADFTEEEASEYLRQYLPLFKLRKMGTCFETISVAPWRQGGGKTSSSGKKVGSTTGEKEGSDEGVDKEGGEIRMVMNPWMRQAWPFG